MWQSFRQTMGDKRTHFGRAGEYFAMSELLLRGWNVAVPVVDVGDDAFVIDDREKVTRRVQVKTSSVSPVEGGRRRATFRLSREQLRTPRPIELFYALMTRSEGRWAFLVIPREDLSAIRDAYVEGARLRPGPGRRPLGDEGAETDSLRLDLDFAGDAVEGWGASLGQYLNCWPEALGVLEGGPGSVGGGATPEATSAFEEGLDRSRGRET
ncbi:MAG TPA: hypothetical protein VFS00_23090 [Polyangiaceae bacterium]|nr:hypothetical protein [Polyangiaceae bacterium]